MTMIPFTNSDGLRDYRHTLVDEDKQHGGRLTALSVLVVIILTVCAVKGAMLWLR